MNLSVKTSKDFRSLLADFPAPTADDMRELGLAAREMILARTRSGRDADGKPFAPYASSYATARAKVGKTGTVNLELSGAMLGDLQVLDATDTSVTLGY